ncbi:hypothetical protein L207DRAFT_557751 [Hyaloscypha variabilis F]|uniref:Inner kinetochore subunit AME1 domain-containing protein n=1 Tax=Hyaloscypha variabilis (strain UAMH 11265 / GT02V1 / F) TaxID=1149755 RepID=A0A2J6R5S5_HYAVF|nr:hypothetical protein L207DRAFT_557751 [Hyaloscypha variabilis F]
MASREERLQARLRGAQRRQVKDVDFGLVFPAAAAPLQPVASNRRTPQPDLPPPSELPAQRSSRRTPAHRESPADTAAVEENNLPALVHSANDANTSAKRRKLDTDVPPSSSTRSTRSSQPRPDIYTINEDEQQESSVIEASNVSIEESTVLETLPESETMVPPPPRITRTPALPAPTQEEFLESPTNAPGSGQRTSVSVLEASIASSHLQEGLEGSSVIETPIPKNQRKRKRRDNAPQPSRKGPVRAASPENDELDELSPEQPERRGQRREVEHSPELEDLAEEEEAEAIDDEKAAVLLRKNRGRRVSRNVHEESPDLDSPEVPPQPTSRKQKGKPRPVSSPAKQSHPKQPSAKTKSKTSKKSKIRIGSPIPVTVHRLSRPLLYDEDELHADILNAEIPRTKRGGVNAVDVLSQICQEIIGVGLDTLEDGWNRCEDPVLRREYRTKLRAVEAFGDELQTRLLEHTINLDNSYSLERRLRDEQKKKLGLREEILRIRAEREQVALKMDDIRIRHENETKKAQERDTLNTTVHDIELAIDLGKSSETDGAEMAGTEVLLKRVADQVSNKSDSGGILRQIKEFNAFLERAALVLESRKA